MIPIIPIAAALLAILDDDEVDLGDLFRRAVAFEKPSLFWRRVPREQRPEVLAALVTYGSQLYGKIPYNDFRSVCSVIHREPLHTGAAQRLASQSLSNIAKEAVDLHDLKDILTGPKMREGLRSFTAVCFYPKDEADLGWYETEFGFYPDVNLDFTKDNERIVVPVWNPNNLHGFTDKRRFDNKVDSLIIEIDAHTGKIAPLWERTDHNYKKVYSKPDVLEAYRRYPTHPPIESGVVTYDVLSWNDDEVLVAKYRESLNSDDGSIEPIKILKRADLEP